MHDSLIIVNGEIPPLALWRDIEYRTLLCTDGAALVLKELGLTPDVILGDMDSITQGANPLTCGEDYSQDYFLNNFPTSKIILASDQNSTDFEKLLNYTIEIYLPDSPRVLCLGALGKQADHAMHNLGLLARYAPGFNQLMFLHTDHLDHKQWVFALGHETLIEAEIGALISIIPLADTQFSSKGLKWELSDTILSPTGSSCVRNRVKSKQLTTLSNGPCLCFITSENPPTVIYK